MPPPLVEKSKKRLLLVSYYCPTRAHAGGLRILDMYMLIKKKCPSVQIDILTHHRPSIDWSLDDIDQVFDNVYFSPVAHLSPAILGQFVDITNQHYDLVDLQFHQAAYSLNGYRKIASKVIFTPMESQIRVLHLELRDQLSRKCKIRLRRLASQLKLACEEVMFCRKADKVVCVSKIDAPCIRAISGRTPVICIDTGLSPLEFSTALADDFVPKKAQDRLKTVIYVAYFGSETNVKALRWYLEKVHPIIVQSVPEYKLVVVGRGDLSSFMSYQGKTVELVGEVPTLEPYIRNANHGIAPALSGAGFRGKVNQYSVLGIPTVISPIALQGLVYQDGISICVADSPEKFAECCIRLLIDDEWNNRIASEARVLCMENYVWSLKWPQIAAVYGLPE